MYQQFPYLCFCLVSRAAGQPILLLFAGQSQEFSLNFLDLHRKTFIDLATMLFFNSGAHRNITHSCIRVLALGLIASTVAVPLSASPNTVASPLTFDTVSRLSFSLNRRNDPQKAPVKVYWLEPHRPGKSSENALYDSKLKGAIEKDVPSKFGFTPEIIGIVGQPYFDHGLAWFKIEEVIRDGRQEEGGKGEKHTAASSNDVHGVPQAQSVPRMHHGQMNMNGAVWWQQWVPLGQEPESRSGDETDSTDSDSIHTDSNSNSEGL
ncbi:hypothetical protein EV361DRAFT_902361 [Lentinula raphanica]|nr:hypothetical protein EV361DRAFT_902361 [Lentinula raphanica]